MNTQSLGKNLLVGMNVATALNGLIADWNRTHLYNDNWPPHAKFHDAMGLSMGVLLGALGIFAAKRKGGNATDNTRLAALCPAVFFGAQLSAFAYPNADTIETEFPDYWPKIGRFSYNEAPFALTGLALTALGWALAESGGKSARRRRPERLQDETPRTGPFDDAEARDRLATEQMAMVP
jgi:hypothetical protein